MGSAFLEQVARLYAGAVDGDALVAGFRDALVVVPTDGHNGILTSDDHGLCWVYAFTDRAALARFAVVRGEGDRSWSFLTTRGARLLDVVVPATGSAAGVAVDVGSARPVFFPPSVPAEGAE